MKIAVIVLSVVLALSIFFLNTVFTELDATTTQLTETEGQLLTTKYELTIIKTQLANTELQLTGTQLTLADTTNQLQTTASELSSTRNELQIMEFQLTSAQNQLRTTQDENLQILNHYSNLSEQISVRLGMGEECKKYITPEDSEVAVIVSQVAGSYSQDISEVWRDYRRLYDWVVKNITYSYDSYLPVLPPLSGGEIIWEQDCWRMPAETLEDKTGDCEDMAVLLASLMLSYNNQGFGVWAIEIHNEDSAHLAVAFPVAGNKLVILDPAGNYYTGYQGGYLQSYDLARATNDWLRHWTTEMPHAQISAVFSNRIYHEFATTQEFIDWAKE